jgi:hypothetical protein
MSALPPKADIARHGGNVRFVPKADIASLLDHLVGAGEQGGRQLEAKGFGHGQIDGQFKVCRLLNWKVGWLFTDQLLARSSESRP